MSISIDRVKEALMNVSQNNEVVYLPEIDRFVYSEDEDFDLDEYEDMIISLPSHYEINNYRMMQDFIEEKTSGEAHDWLANAIIGRGAFHRFKVTCERFDLLNEWYKYEESRYEDMAVLWCEDNGLEYHYEHTQVIEEDDEEEEPVRQTVIEKKNNVRIVNVDEKNAYVITYMVVNFRKELAVLKNRKSTVDITEANEEIEYYLKKQYPIFAASISGNYVGYAVCKVEDDVVWLESIYVKKEFRNKGIATKLLEKCEEIGKEHDNDTLYINIHPNNEAVINFLNKNGYNVLNLIEVRKNYEGEKTESEYSIGQHSYKY
ncbi:MAG: GNAT family N-acetyltransferase [Erysipelotrichaceae bacterium]|nr:GNAT family N-acetyltransferase [Erysipelotrichaceae bacterium]